MGIERAPAFVVARLLMTAALLMAALCGSAAEPPTVRWTPERLVNGSAFLVRVTPTGAWQSLTGEFEGRRLFFDREASSGEWVGFAGVGFDASKGSHALALRAVSVSGSETAFAVSIPIEHALRPRSALRVPAKFVEPDARTRARIKKEQAIKADFFSRITSRRLSDLRFARPVTVETSEGYGVERVFNGKRQSVHLGLDYRAPMGTPVGAASGGRILLARDFFYEGRFVAIDHGHGLMTLYLHLSRIDVAEGDEVTAGQELGLSGASGRATGPHLHLAVRWQSLYLDPNSLLELVQ